MSNVQTNERERYIQYGEELIPVEPNYSLDEIKEAMAQIDARFANCVLQENIVEGRSIIVPYFAAGEKGQE